MGVLGRSDDAVAAYDEVISRFGDDPAAALREQVATALDNKGTTLGQLGRSDDEVAAYDEVISRFGDDPAPALQKIVQLVVALGNDA